MSKTWPSIQPEIEKKLYYPSVKYRKIDPVTGDWRFAFVRLPDKFHPDENFAQDQGKDWQNWEITEDDKLYPDTLLSAENEGFEIYNSALHDLKHLMCPDMGCDAPMKHIAENADTGRAEHWKARNNLDHKEDCRYRHHHYDEERGLKVKIKMKGLSNPLSSETMMDNLREKYSGDKEKHPKFAEAEKIFEGMERFCAEGVQDIIKLYRKAGIDRALASTFKKSGVYYSESEFLVRRPMADEENRFKNLYDRLIAIPHGNHLPVVMQFHMKHEHIRSNPNGTVASQAIFLKRELGDIGTDGAVHFMIPRAKPVKGKSLTEVFREAGDYLLYGSAVLSDVIERDDKVFHYVDIEIHDIPRQVTKVAMTNFIPCLQPKSDSQTVLPFNMP